jgi:ABC-2 type transport system permease protein
MALRTQTRLASESALFLLILGAILVLLNVLGVFGVHTRADATDAKLFSLSDGSKRLAASLTDQMEVRAYFSKDLPPPYNAMGRYVRDLLAEYRDASNGKLKLRVIEPQTDEEKQAAERDGVLRMQDQKLEADSFGVQEGYRGISFHYLGKSKALAHVDTTQGLEYEITQILKQMIGEKTSVGVLGGHEGPTLSKGLQAFQQYLPTYKLEEVKAEQEIDPKYKTLLIIHPETAISDAELRNIDKFVMNGGSLAVFGGTIKVAMEQQQQGAPPSGPKGTPTDTGLNKLLEKWSITLDNRIVADAQCGRARMPTNIPGLAIPVPYPPVPVITFDETQREHPALFRINQIPLPYPVRIALNDNLKGDAQVKRTVLARSTRQAWLMEGDTIDLQARQQWDVPGYSGPYTIGAAVEGKLPSAFAGAEVSNSPAEGETPAAPSNTPDRAKSPVRVLVFGSGYFVSDEFLPPPREGQTSFSGAVAFALNAIDWLSQDADLIEIRAKNIEDPMLELPQNVAEAEAEIRKAVENQDEATAKKAFEERKGAMQAWDARKAAYRWGNSLAIPGAFAMLGIIRWRVRRARKAKLAL